MFLQLLKNYVKKKTSTPYKCSCFSSLDIIILSGCKFNEPLNLNYFNPFGFFGPKCIIPKIKKKAVITVEIIKNVTGPN